MKKNFLILFYVCFLFSCGETDNKRHLSKKEKQAVKQKMMDVNNYMEKKESDEIDAYVLQRKLNMVTTGTGLRYVIVKKGDGSLAKAGQTAKVNYKISLLDGTVCYTSEKDGPKEFKIGEDYVETGIHEGVQLMHTGDKAVFIVPRHLAHGMMGDYDKIPPLSTIVYEIELLSVR